MKSRYVMVIIFLTGLLIFGICLAQNEKGLGIDKLTDLELKALEKKMRNESLAARQQRIVENTRKLILSEAMEESEALVGQHHTCKAIVQDNINECDVLTEDRYVEKCKNRFILTNFYKFLKEFRETKELSSRGFDWCRLAVGHLIDSVDENFCIQIGQAHITGNVSAIEKHFGMDRIGLGFITGDGSYCDEIVDVLDAIDCRDNVIYTQAVVIKNDKYLCEEIKNNLARELCRIALKDKATIADCREFLYEEIEEKKRGGR